MAKKLSKKEKLDYVVDEIASVKELLKKLFRQQLLLADEVSRLARTQSTRSKPVMPANKPVKSKPVLVQSTQEGATKARG